MVNPSKLGAAAALALLTPWALAACGSEDTAATPAPSGACPAAPVEVVVSVDQWGDIVSQLGGDCAQVRTVIAGSSVDPHDYEPAPSDAVAFEDAQLVVINGGHYDEWAAKLAATSAPDAPLISAVDLAGGHDHGDHDHDHEGHDHGDDHEGHDHDHEGHDHGGTNPHAWYRPATVHALADAVTAELGNLAPDAREYFEARRAEFADRTAEYDSLIERLRTEVTGKTYAATESVFDDMAAAVGLQDRTPPGYQVSASNETDPSPGDLAAFLTLLEDRGVDVLIVNTQTEGSMPAQLRGAAEAAGVPLVEVTETVAPGADSFQAWQVDQLRTLAEALGVSA
ncbi:MULTISPECIES: metal ABC transporter solute-binding protein, Zn/Mn family [Mycolicibacterium]|nr:zinc ABC transporter substrate-binding protein [Mycolicibacterium chitae]MCV7106579.1 zinc ABC transporter substrate-binding protein [Mycolicibacterium chitae]